MRSGVLCLGLMVAVVAHAGEAPGFWERAADPRGAEVERLMDAAKAELDPQVLGGVGPPNAVKAEVWLRQALARQPRHFVAALLLGEALAVQRRSQESIAQLARACGLATTADEERFCVLRLAVERSKAGHYLEALAAYDRHIRIGQPLPAAYANSAELLMALGRLDEAETRYRRAIAIHDRESPGRARNEAIALSSFGLAVALDRAGRASAAQEAMAVALRLDPRLELLDGGGGGVFFVPPGDVLYYRGLAFEQLRRPREATDAFRRFVTEHGSNRYRRQAEAHLQTLATSAPAPTGGAAVRVVAAATVHAEGPLPSPLIDAQWRGRAVDLAACFESVPVTGKGATTRVAIDLLIAPAGTLEKVEPHLPDGWQDAGPCVEKRLRAGLRLPKVSKKEGRTSARVELVLAVKQR